MIALQRDSLDIFLDYKKTKIDSLKNLISGQNYPFTVLENHHGCNLSRVVALGDINFILMGHSLCKGFFWSLCLNLLPT